MSVLPTLVEYDDSFDLTNLSVNSLIALRNAMVLAMYHGEFSESHAFLLEDMYDQISYILYEDSALSLHEAMDNLEELEILEGVY